MSNSDSPARTLSSHTIYRGRIFTLDLERVQLPHGPVVNMEIVRHPGSVVLIPMPAPGQIILVRQYRHVVGRYLWELPAGSLAEGEDPVEGARRECHEEIGLVPGRLEQLAGLYPTPGFCSERMFFFRCTELQEPTTEAHQDEDEQIEPRTFTLDEIRAMLGTGDIADMKTAVGLGLVEGW
jgi:ADP-ribose pyrophosphatase